MKYVQQIEIDGSVGETEMSGADDGDRKLKSRFI